MFFNNFKCKADGYHRNARGSALPVPTSRYHVMNRSNSHS